MADRSRERQWLTESLKYFSELDFFVNQDISANGIFFEDLLSKIPNIDPDPEFSDLLLLANDQSRVWPVDGEFAVGMGNDRYVDFLEGLAAISRGTFQPVDIIELWAADEGPIQITFTLEERLRQLNPAYISDWLDGAIVNEINQMIAGSGMQIEIYAGSSQIANMLFLRAEE